MSWKQILTDAGLSEREVDAVIVLSNKSNLKASELAKELGTTRLDAYNSLERLQTIGLVTVTADRPMRFSSPPINEAVRHLIGIRKDQLLRIEQGFEELQKGINYTAEATEAIAKVMPVAKAAVPTEPIPAEPMAMATMPLKVKPVIKL